MVTVARWTGRESRLLREAMRLSVRDFADKLGVSDRAVSKWESGGGAFNVPNHESQAILDTVLRERVSAEARARFELALSGEAEAGRTGRGAGAAAREVHGPARLHALVKERHWLVHETFEAQFMRAARELAKREEEPRIARATVSKRTFTRWLSGDVKTMPHPDACRVLEYMFGLPARELLRPGEPARDVRPVASVSGERAVDRLVLDVSSLLPEARDEGGDDPVRRREFGAAAAVSAMSLLDVMRGHSAELPERVAHGSRVDGETAAGLANVVLGYRQIYQSAGAGALLDPVCGTLGLLTGLAPGAGVYRDQIVSLIGQTGSLAATMLMLDRGNYPAALRYLALAARAAQQSGDRELLSVTMAARAFHSSYSGDPVDGLAFAREAVSIASHGAHPRTYGWVSAVESEMHATVGDEAGYRRSLETAQVQVAAPMPDWPWKGIGAFSEAKLTAYRGAGLMRLRRYRDAQPVLLQALRQLDPVQAKHRCTAHIDLADAYASDRKPDEAAHHGISALDIIAVTGHAESLRRVAGIYERVRPSGTPTAREFGSRLLEVRAGSVG